MFPILDKLVRCCTPKESLRQVQSLISNEKFHYVEPHHGRMFVERLWTLETAVEKHQVEVFGKGIDMWLRAQGEYIMWGESV